MIIAQTWSLLQVFSTFTSINKASVRIMRLRILWLLLCYSCPRSSGVDKSYPAINDRIGEQFGRKFEHTTAD